MRAGGQIVRNADSVLSRSRFECPSLRSGCADIAMNNVARFAGRPWKSECPGRPCICPLRAAARCIRACADSAADTPKPERVDRPRIAIGECPKCHSNQTIRAPAAYEQGTSKTRAGSAGVAFAGNEMIPVF